MRYSDRQRVQKIYEYAVRLQKYIVENHIDKEALLNELPLQWLVTTPLYNMGEHSYHLSTVHNYDGTNWSIIADVVFEELPILTMQLDMCLREDENTNIIR